MYSGTAGGPNWGGGAFDPARQPLVTSVSQVGMWLRLIEGGRAIDDYLIAWALPSTGLDAQDRAVVGGDVERTVGALHEGTHARARQLR